LPAEGGEPSRSLDRVGAAGIRAVARGILCLVTLDEIVAAIRSLPVPERLRVIELAAHDTLIDRNGFLVAHGEPGAVLPEDAFDHRADRDARAESLWSRS